LKFILLACVIGAIVTNLQWIRIGLAILLAVVVSAAVLMLAALGIRKLWHRYDLNPKYKAYLPLVRTSRSINQHQPPPTFNSTGE
jgi:membrane protein implicated in regulation of membrane protease activity